MSDVGGERENRVAIENPLETEAQREWRLNYYEWILDCMSRQQEQGTGEEKRDG